MEQAYLDIVLDALGSKTLWAFTNESRYIAYFAFGGLDMRLASVLACIGATVGCMINYLVGWVFSILQQRGISTIKAETYSLWQRRFTVVIAVIGAFSWVHLVGGVLVTAAGFLRVKAYYVLPAILLGYIAYYSYQYVQYAA